MSKAENTKPADTAPMSAPGPTKHKKHAIAIPPAFTLKLLVACISVAFYVLLAVFVGLIFAGTRCDFSVLEESTALPIWGLIVLFFVFLFLTLSAVHVILAILAGPEINHKYQKFYRKVGIWVLFFVFISMGCLDTTIIINISSARFVAGLAMFFAGLLSFAPLLSAWQIREEDRLKNFIDAMSRVCTTLTFIGGICAFLINALIG